MDELFKLLGEKELEIYMLKKHVHNLEKLNKNLQIEVENSPKMEMVRLPEGTDPSTILEEKEGVE